MDEVDFTILAAKSVLTDMMDKCPPAETCRDAFDRTAKATIKMASSAGGFGAPVNQRRSRREAPQWKSNTPDSTISSQSRHRTNNSDQTSLQFDLALSDAHSSPTMSMSGDMAQQSPPLQRTRAFEGADSYMLQPRARGGPTPPDMSMKPDRLSRDPSAGPSPTIPRRVTSQPSMNAAFNGQQLNNQSAMDYPDASTMEFLQSLSNAPSGEFGSLDPSQVDLGLGMNWEGLQTDYGDGPQMNNPFDTFFFGGQQGGGGGMGM